MTVAFCQFYLLALLITNWPVHITILTRMTSHEWLFLIPDWWILFLWGKNPHFSFLLSSQRYSSLADDKSGKLKICFKLLLKWELHYTKIKYICDFYYTKVGDHIIHEQIKWICCIFSWHEILINTFFQLQLQRYFYS